MQEVFNFLKENWTFIVEVVIALSVLVLTVFKRRNVNSILAQLYEWCVSAVNIVEMTDLKGQDKLNKALDIVNVFIKAEYPKLDINNYRHCAVAIIENILSTPHKKGE